MRYYLVGEYGDVSFRPHYHLALFGFDCADPGGRAVNPSMQHRCSCSNCSLIRNTWGKGRISVDALERQSAQYIGGYVTKKLTKKDDPRLGGRYPEFARMSLRPGIGAGFVDQLADAQLTEAGANELIKTGDVFTVLRHEKQKMPLGRYLRRKLRERLGFKETGSQKEVIQKFKEEMRELCATLLDDPKNKNKTFGQMLLEENKQKVLNLETKQNIYKKRGNL